MESTNATENGFAHSKRFKLVFLGNAGVGKTALVHRVVKDEWSTGQHSTIGASYFRHCCHVGAQTVGFDVWDTAGQERFHALASLYYRGAAVAIVVYDLCSTESFSRAHEWVAELRLHSQKMVVALVGNKADLSEQRAVDCVLAEEYAAQKHLLFAEVSAKEGTGVAELMDAVAQRVLEDNPAPCPCPPTNLPARKKCCLR